MSDYNRCSSPSELKITDMRFVDIVDAPMNCTIVRIDTNQGISGYGEIRDFSNKFYALQLKRLILGENPCNINKIFGKIKQFGYHGRQGGGVSGIEIALWDLAGKAYGVPVYQMLGGKSRENVRIYCDTDVDGKHSGKDMGRALKERMDKGFTFLKMDLGIDLLLDVENSINAPLGIVDKMKSFSQQELSFGITNKQFADFMNKPHSLTGISINENGLDYLENYLKEVRDIIGYEIPLAIDHIGHCNFQSIVKLAERIEKYNIAWMEDCIPWMHTNLWRELADKVNIPLCTGEDIYLADNFEELFESGSIHIIHPDVLTIGGISEVLKVTHTADKYGIATAVHMAETPIGCMAAAHASTAMNDTFLAMEFHSNDVPWWDSMVKDSKENIVQNGYITLTDKPGLGIDDLDDEVLKEHINPDRPGMWEDTSQWDNEWVHDRIWS